MIYTIPAVLGILIKLSILYFASTSQRSKPFILFITLLSVHNLSELLLFYYQFSGSDALFAMRMYYACIAGVAAGMCVYAVDITKTKNKNLIQLIIFSLFSVFSLLVMFTPWIIIGSQPISYAITAIKGNYYYLFQLMAICSIVFTLFILVRTFLSTKETQTKIKSAYLLASLIPGVLISIGVIMLMNAGYQINAMSIFPIGTTLVVLITLKGESKHQMTDIRRFLPFSKERKISNQLMDIISDYSINQQPHKKTINEIEKVLIQYAYEKSGRCKSSTAKRIHVSRSTLYTMFDRLKIKD